MDQFSRALADEHSDLIARVATRFVQRRGSEWFTKDDAISAGGLALCNAAVTYRGEMGPFRKYASSALYKAMCQEFKREAAHRAASQQLPDGWGEDGEDEE